MITSTMQSSMMVTGDQHGVPRVVDVVLQMVQNPARFAHATGRDDDAGFGIAIQGDKPEAKRTARQWERLQNKIGDLFEHRYLFVQRDLTPAERRRLHRITRGLPQLRTLRDIMEEVYRLFDRRYRTDTALAKLRRRVRRFKCISTILSKLRSANLDKALTRSLMTSCCRRLPTPWNGGTAGTGQCRRRYIASAPVSTSTIASPSTCSANRRKPTVPVH
jgi:hypothetical protein